MYKLAALTAVAAASNIEEFKQTAEMFKITLHQQEVMGLEQHAHALEMESRKYEMQMQNSHHGAQFQQEGEALVHTKEFVSLAKYVEAVKKAGPTEQMKKVKAAYMAQIHKVEAAHMALKRTTQQNIKIMGQQPHQTAIVDVNNDQWIVFNKEYYKLREMEYYIAYKVPQVVGLRKHVRELVETNEFEAMENHWEQVTQQHQHQVVVHHQANLVKAAVMTLHMEEAEKKWMDPAVSPVMFDVWHMVYCYFMAVGKGDLEPMLDFMIDGEYDDDFVKAVKPHFPAPKNYPDDLYLF